MKVHHIPSPASDFCIYSNELEVLLVVDLVVEMKDWDWKENLMQELMFMEQWGN